MIKEFFAERYNYWKGQSKPQPSRLFLFWYLNLLFVVTFISFFILARQNPFTVLVPGAVLHWPGIDTRDSVNLYLPVEGDDRFVPTPQYISLDFEENENKIQVYVQRVFDLITEGRLRKRPGDAFHPSDDLILEVQTSIPLRAVWQQDDKLYIDLEASEVEAYKAADLYDLLKCFHLTVTENSLIASGLPEQIKYRLDGRNPKGWFKKFSLRSDEENEPKRLALKWPPKKPASKKADPENTPKKQG